jgi:hypothetical protein
MNAWMDGHQSIDNDHMIAIGIDRSIVMGWLKKKGKHKNGTAVKKKDGILSFSSRIPRLRLCPRNLRRLLKVHTLARATGTMHLHPPCHAQNPGRIVQ